jgi:glycosyltransferase involved in cell wall biosynthesis
MKIGHYAHRINARGGIASYVRRLGKAQTARGREIVYLSRTQDADASSPIRTVQSDAPFSDARDLNLDLLHLHHPVSPIPEDRVPTIRTVHNNHGSCPSGSRYLKRTGLPCNRDYSIAGCLWGHFVDHCGSRRPQKTVANFRTINREQKQAATLSTLTVSGFLKRRMVRSGCPSDNLHVLRSPAPKVDDSFTPLDGQQPPRFVFAGRITPMKGLDWLLRALAQTRSDAHLDVAGTGNEEYMSEMHKLAAELNLRDRVTFHGWLDQVDVYALIRRARALVFPSVWHEPAGLVTLEAAARGRAVVASDVGGIPEYARDEYATLVNVRDVDALAQAMEHLATNEDEANRRGRRARKQARTTFSMDGFLERLNQFYERTCRSS